ncbi:MAG: fluoride efflux transporter CrcB [Calditrichaeota bacterium]|nr:MAG: fluoride efflux transporter CrcB [Calditrichota bacterium]
MIKILAIGAGGFAGAILRYWISGWVYAFTQSDFPIGTLVVNAAGSFLLGLFMGYSEQLILSPTLKAMITIGLLGAFTTFSTFSYETVMLLRVGAPMKAFLNIVLSILLGLTLAFVGLVVGKNI